MIAMRFSGDRSYDWKNIAGFKICAAFDDSGFADTFHIHALLWDNVQNYFGDFSFEGPQTVRGKLILSDEHFTYIFENVDWICKCLFITQSQRVWLLTFKYDRTLLNPSQDNYFCPIQVSNNKEGGLEEHNNSSGYMIKIDNALPKPLLGFQAIQNPTASNIYRFITYRDKSNSWLEELLKQNDSVNSKGVMDGFNITLNNHKFEIKSFIKPIIYYEESFGILSALDYYPLNKLVTPKVVKDVFDVELEGLMKITADLLDQHNVQRDLSIRPPQNLIETATVLLQAKGRSADYPMQ